MIFDIKILFVYGEDWEAVYLGNALFRQGHAITPEDWFDLISHITKGGLKINGFKKIEVVDPDGELFRYPESFSDFPAKFLL